MGRRQNASNEFILKVWQKAELTPSYVVLMAVSGVLAAVAFATGSIPILLGAMIVAPLMTPLALLIVGLCGGQPWQALRGLGTTMLGLGTALAAAVAAAWLIDKFALSDAPSVFLGEPLFEERVRPGWYSLIAAAAAGIAGTTAVVKDKTDTLIGSIASVALVPAAGASGIAFVEGDALRALGGLALLFVNVLLIVAMGILVVLVVRPGVKTKLPGE